MQWGSLKNISQFNDYKNYFKYLMRYNLHSIFSHLVSSHSMYYQWNEQFSEHPSNYKVYLLFFSVTVSIINDVNYFSYFPKRLVPPTKIRFKYQNSAKTLKYQWTNVETIFMIHLKFSYKISAKTQARLENCPGQTHIVYLLVLSIKKC